MNTPASQCTLYQRNAEILKSNTIKLRLILIVLFQLSVLQFFLKARRSSRNSAVTRNAPRGEAGLSNRRYRAFETASRHYPRIFSFESIRAVSDVVIARGAAI